MNRVGEIHLAIARGCAALQRFLGEPNLLDQLLVNRGFFADESPWRVKENSVEIVRLPEMLDSHGAPRRFGRPSDKSSFDPTGFSDHLPVACRVVERG